MIYFIEPLDTTLVLAVGFTFINRSNMQLSLVEDGVVDVWTDGATEGFNKGGWTTHVGVGVYIPELGVEYSERTEGYSNNEAEYFAVIRAMEILVQKKIKRVKIYCDNTIVVNGASGKYKNKISLKSNIRMQSFKARCLELSKLFDKIEFIWIPREENEEADKLSKLKLLTPDYV